MPLLPCVHKASSQLQHCSSMHFRALSRPQLGSLRCSSHNSSRVLLLPKMFCLRAGSQNSSLLSLAAFMAHRALAFWASCGFFNGQSFTHCLVGVIHFFPIFSFDALVQRLAESMPVSINQVRAHLSGLMWLTSMYASECSLLPPLMSAHPDFP